MSHLLSFRKLKFLDATGRVLFVPWNHFCALKIYSELNFSKFIFQYCFDISITSISNFIVAAATAVVVVVALILI